MKVKSIESDPIDSLSSNHKAAAFLILLCILLSSWAMPSSAATTRAAMLVSATTIASTNLSQDERVDKDIEGLEAMLSLLVKLDEGGDEVVWKRQFVQYLQHLFIPRGLPYHITVAPVFSDKLKVKPNSESAPSFISTEIVLRY